MPLLPMVLLPVALLGAGEDVALDTAVAAAREAIRARLGAADSRIHVVEAVASRWADASLGCPEKGVSYAQVLTAGHQVRLRVEDRTFDVRVAAGRTVVCGLGTATPGAEADAAATTRLYRTARRDLAKRLGKTYTLKDERIWNQDNQRLAPYGLGNAWVSNTFHHYCLQFRKE